jgi:hypothetical protein
MITEGASSIYDMSYGGHGSAGDYFSVDVHEESRREDDKLAIQMIRRMEFGRLLSYGVSVVEIYLFLANSFRGLLFINFSLRDIKKLEETEQVQTLVDLYDIGCDDLRAVLGGQMSIQNLISFGWKAKTFRTLGIDMHQLCILKLQKDNIPTFGFTIDEWLNELRMTKTVVKILRIHANDFQKPGGKLAGVGWDLARIIHQLKITVEEVVDFRLNGYSSCLGRKVSDDRGFTDRTPKKILKKLSSSGTHSTGGSTLSRVYPLRRSPELRVETSVDNQDGPSEREDSWRKKPLTRGGGPTSHHHHHHSHGGRKKVAHYNPKHTPSHHRPASRRNGGK